MGNNLPAPDQPTPEQIAYHNFTLTNLPDFGAFTFLSVISPEDQTLWHDDLGSVLRRYTLKEELALLWFGPQNVEISANRILLTGIDPQERIFELHEDDLPMRFDYLRLCEVGYNQTSSADLSVVSKPRYLGQADLKDSSTTIPRSSVLYRLGFAQCC